MLEIRPFTPADLDVVTALAREQDFAPGIGDIEIYANTDRQGVWLAWQDNAPVSCIAAVTYNPDCQNDHNGERHQTHGPDRAHVQRRDAKRPRPQRL